MITIHPLFLNTAFPSFPIPRLTSMLLTRYRLYMTDNELRLADDLSSMTRYCTMFKWFRLAVWCHFIVIVPFVVVVFQFTITTSRSRLYIILSVQRVCHDPVRRTTSVPEFVVCTKATQLDAMSDEDDYLSDKFLLESSSSAAAPKTYSQTRKQALKQQRLKNEQNRQISQRQRELEAREEGLSKSLFARAKEEEAAGVGSGNKALSIMMKMGFKPGESLGKTDDGEPSTFQIPPVQPESSTSADTTPTPQDSTALVPKTPKESTSQHKTEPLPINEWAGKPPIDYWFL